MSTAMIILIVLALGFDFLNGIHDSSNIVATIISSRALAPRWALAMTAAAEFSGPLIFGVAVATTIGDQIVAPAMMTMAAIIATLCSAIIWNLATWFFGIPSSSSHALIGGLVGAVAASAGFKAIQFAGMEKVLIALFTSPFIGFLVGWLVSKIIVTLCANTSPRVNVVFKRGQILTAISLALSHGTNDAQKSMGIITLGLLITHNIDRFAVPIWVILACAGMIALGTSLGGWKLIKTLGARFYRIRPVDGFSAQLSSAVVILAASLFGGPVSTTQVVSTAIMGVGAAERVNKVRWGVAGEIAMAWLLTIPANALLGAGIYMAIHHLF